MTQALKQQFSEMLASRDSELGVGRLPDGKLSVNSRAAVAVRGLQSCEAADKTAALEDLFERWLNDPKKGSKRAKKLELARKPLLIFREQIAILAGALSDLMAQSSAAGIQESNQAEYLRMCGELRDFRTFIARHYPNQMEQAVSLNKPVLDLARELILNASPQPKSYFQGEIQVDWPASSNAEPVQTESPAGGNQ